MKKQEKNWSLVKSARFQEKADMNSPTAFFIGAMLTALLFIDFPPTVSIPLAVFGGIILALFEWTPQSSGESRHD